MRLGQQLKMGDMNPMNYIQSNMAVSKVGEFGEPPEKSK